jgi:parvulin-like peptidyl-prolyl isomerase
MEPLLIVNGEEVDLKESLEVDILHEDTFLKGVTENILIRQEAEKRGIKNSDEELQVAVDELRYQRNLESVDKAQVWLKNSHLSLEGVQAGVDLMLLRNKLRNSFSDSEVEAYFAEHKLDFDKVETYSIRLATKEKADEILTQIKDEGLDFSAAAVKYSEDDATKKLGGYVGLMGRKDVIGEIEAALFSPMAKEGDIVGPVKTDKGFNLFKVGEVQKANLDKSKNDIKFFLFNDLLNKLKAEAKISMPVLG